MYEHLVRAGFDEDRGIAVRIVDHEMHVEFQRRRLSYRLHDRRSDGEIGHEMAVHDIDVNDGCAALLHSGDLFAQTRKIGGQDRWKDFNHSAGLKGNFNTAAKNPSPASRPGMRRVICQLPGTFSITASFSSRSSEQVE